MRTPIQNIAPTEVERIVGQQRWHFEHVGMYDGRTITILHSRRCLQAYEDLRECVFSQALANGTTAEGTWIKDYPHLLEVKGGLLHPGLPLNRTYIPTPRMFGYVALP